MKFKDIATSDRPRERLQKFGATALSNAELLALILRQGSPKENVLLLSQRLLKNTSLQQLAQKSLPEFTTIKGIGNAKSAQLVACFELGRRVATTPDQPKLTINTAQAVHELLAPSLSNLNKEHVVVLYLNARKQVINQATISIGSLDASIVHPREIFAPALSERAAAVIVVHNHPSGDPTPSEEDVAITEQLILAGDVLGVSLLDHIIIARNSYFSFQEEGLLYG